MSVLPRPQLRVRVTAARYLSRLGVDLAPLALLAGYLGYAVAQDDMPPFTLALVPVVTLVVAAFLLVIRPVSVTVDGEIVRVRRLLGPAIRFRRDDVALSVRAPSVSCTQGPARSVLSFADRRGRALLRLDNRVFTADDLGVLALAIGGGPGSRHELVDGPCTVAELVQGRQWAAAWGLRHPYVTGAVLGLAAFALVVVTGLLVG
ncbi:hypothetical protein GIS00_13155 [Nakamurella sp. YIM 132087]|uniref:PH domain-containing protein n=1 Tax=Nakamurella alba TaxID=2665158 RepID=A0A7K1FLA7_9ACTN|nr:hypothetical protein [Nakamurella alba]MTD14888.1 hypothetical protein [Nakamurella alba]